MSQARKRPPEAISCSVSLPFHVLYSGPLSLWTPEPKDPSLIHLCPCIKKFVHLTSSWTAHLCRFLSLGEASHFFCMIFSPLRFCKGKAVERVQIRSLFLISFFHSVQVFCTQEPPSPVVYLISILH